MIRRVSALALAVPLLFATGAVAGGPQVSPNIQVNDPQQLFPLDLPSRNTTTLAASGDSQNLLAGWDDFQGFCGPLFGRNCPPLAIPGSTGFAFSTDGGATWTDAGTPYPLGPLETAGHPWADRGGEGDNEVFYLASRLRDATGGFAGLAVHRGAFAAGTFAWQDAQVINSANPKDFYSRQALAAAKDGSGAAYLVLTNAEGICGKDAFGFGTIEVWRTHDSGATWQGPAIVSPDASDTQDPSNPLCGNTGYFQVASAVAVGPDSQEVYLVWQYGPYTYPDQSISNRSALAFARSLDGGVTFDEPKLLVAINANRENPPVGYGKNRMNDQPRIAVATTGPHRGRVYVTFYQPVQPVSSPVTAQSAVSTDAYITYSDDRGETWSEAKPIAPPVPPLGVKRIWPTVAVRPGGDVDVVYLESRETQVTVNPTDVECSVLVGGGLRRTGTLSSLVDTYWVQSRDGGATFSAPVRLSDATSNWCTAAYLGVGPLYSSFGDYLGIATGGDRTFALWPDSRNGVVDAVFAEVQGKANKEKRGTFMPWGRLKMPSVRTKMPQGRMTVP